ncbi:MAG: DNA replication and repair protein RecF [Gemmatimonadaceae bacterium]
MLRRLVLRDFRNFEKLDVEIPEAGLVIVGENGHGKTNLLEAISYLGLFRSVRGSRDVDAIRFGAPAFYVRAGLIGPQLSESVSVGYERATKRKKAIVYGVEQPRLSTALGALPSVCFSPVDVALVAGGPAERRHFLDVTLALTDARYLQALQHYRAALRQRNAALRTAQRAGARPGGAHDAQVSIWEPTLAQHGATLVALRRTWCDKQSARFSSLCAAIGERLHVSLRYDGAAPSGAASHHASADSTERRFGSIDTAAGERTSDAQRTSAHDTARETAQALHLAYRDTYTRMFEQQRANELRRGVTLVGPHRDDLQLMLGARDLRTFGSNGQQRTAAIALRMLELATRREALAEPPLLLLDDPFAELDVKRSARILALLEEVGVGQVILAVPRAEDIPAAFTRLERRAMVDGVLQ